MFSSPLPPPHPPTQASGSRAAGRPRSVARSAPSLCARPAGCATTLSFGERAPPDLLSLNLARPACCACCAPPPCLCRVMPCPALPALHSAAQHSTARPCDLHTSLPSIACSALNPAPHPALQTSPRYRIMHRLPHSQTACLSTPLSNLLLYTSPLPGLSHPSCPSVPSPLLTDQFRVRVMGNPKT